MSVAGGLRIAALLALAAYNLATFHDTLVEWAPDHAADAWREAPAWIKRRLMTGVEDWPANWRMFTFKDTTQVFVDFEGQTADDGDHWQRLPMERWLPARWESGFRWDKGNYNNAEAQRGWLRVACARANEEAYRATPMVRTRAVVVHWRKTTGQAWQPEKDRSEKVLGEMACRR